jgi:ribosomal protein S18 acetylase RimI-like enzyme
MRCETSMADLRIAALTSADADAIARVHARAFPDAAITALGPDIIVRYYEWLLDGPHDAEILGAWHADRLVGFCAAGVFRGAMSGFLRRNRYRLAARVLRHPRLLSNEIVRDRIVAAARTMVRFSRFTQVMTPQEPPHPRFAILAVATDPDVRGLGAGRALMLASEQRARERQFAQMTLSVHRDNARAIRFYEQLGWARAGAPWTGQMTKQLA